MRPRSGMPVESESVPGTGVFRKKGGAVHPTGPVGGGSAVLGDSGAF